MTADGRERFLRELAERISPERITAAHLFPAIRQGGVESGVAVIAVQGSGEAAMTDAARGERVTVLRASYVLQLKGPDRGAWSLQIVEEADAPPPTVDDVVHGVHRRAGADDEPERLEAEDFRVALGGEPWTGLP